MNLHALLPAGRHRGIAAAVLVGCAGAALGYLLPAYFGTFGMHAGTAAAVPLGLCAALLFLGDRRLFLWAVLATRASCDVVFESARGALGGGLGLGALVNAAVIAVALCEALRPGGAPLDRARHQAVLLAWGGFFATCAYGVMLSPEPVSALRLTLAWAANFAVFYCALCYTRSAADLRSHVDLVIGSSLIPVACAAWQVAASGGAGRIAGTFTHPNIFAFYLVLVITLLFYRLKGSAHPGWRSAGLAYLALLAGMLALTQTRSAWLACFLVFAGYGLLRERRYLAYMGLACALALLFEPVRERLLDLRAPEVTTSQTRVDSLRWRLDLWHVALQWMAAERMPFGHGIGAFSHYAPEFYRRGAGIHWDAHNVYVQWFFDVGLVGLCAYLWLQLRVLAVVVRSPHRDALLRYVAAATVIGYLLVALSDNLMFYLAYNWYHWFFTGTAVAVLARAPRGAGPPDARPMPREIFR